MRAPITIMVDDPPSPPPRSPRILTGDALAFFRDNGDVVVRGAVTPGHCRAAAEALWAFLEMDPADRTTGIASP